MAEKIIVIAGTPVDTHMGADVVTTNSFEALEFPISSTPQEQNKLQYLERAYLQELYEAKVQEGILAGGKAVFLYCNSLSTAIDYKDAAKRLEIQTVSPLDIYADWAEHYSRLGLITANSQAAAGIEAQMRSTNPHLNIISFGLLPVVQAIEAQRPALDIIEDFGLAQLLDWLASTQFEHPETNNSFGDSKKNASAPASSDDEMRRDGAAGLEGIILGCTHFPYLKAELTTITNIPLLDPAEEMLKRL